jgi:hypothetical protein
MPPAGENIASDVTGLRAGADKFAYLLEALGWFQGREYSSAYFPFRVKSSPGTAILLH